MIAYEMKIPNFALFKMELYSNFSFFPLKLETAT